MTTHFTASDGSSVSYYLRSNPYHDSEGFVIVHGLGEHASRYDTFIEDLCASYPKMRNKNFLAIELRGHGKNISHNAGAAKGHFDGGGFARIFLDITEGIKTILVDELECTKLTLFGHSLGGFIAFEYARSMICPIPIKRLILSSPAFLPGKPIPSLKYYSGRLFAPLLPKLTISNGMPITNLSREPSAVEAYQRDPQTHSKISLGTAVELMERENNVMRMEQFNFSFPVLLAHGTSDLFTSFSASQRIFERIQCTGSKKFLEYPGGYHELHNDIIKEDLFRDYAAWLEETE